MAQTNYDTFEGGFHMLDLECSNVLNLKTTMSFVDLHMDFVVNEDYPLYVQPDEENEEYYCYRRGRIFFPNLEEIRWTARIHPAIDPTGTVDYGTIDYFYEEDGWYKIGGEWGALEMISGPPILEIDELKQHHAQQGSQKSASKESGEPTAPA